MGGNLLLPWFMDIHIHVENENDLRQMARCGVTTGLDMTTWLASRPQSLRGRVGLRGIRGPRVLVTCKGSIHSHILPIPQEVLVAGPEDVNQFVAREGTGLYQNYRGYPRARPGNT